jgi:LPXTG-site transpeptidase (sortase) family protein
VQVASQVDDQLPAGGVGMFVGGDGNDVAIERLVVRTPAEQGPQTAQAAERTDQRAISASSPARRLPITRVVVPSIGLDSAAVPADLVEREGSVTWDVPAHTIGHAQATAGAGSPGNAVLVGHVNSLQLGNVFANLHAVSLGDVVQVYSADQQFEYRAVDIRTVPRTAVEVVQPTEQPSLTLITCTGLWLPIVSDYTERLVVRAEATRR